MKWLELIARNKFNSHSKYELAIRLSVPDEVSDY